MLQESEFNECVRRAAVWMREQEDTALREGVALSVREQAVAREAGVREIERVRLVPVAAMPAPDDAVLQEAMRATGFWLHGAAGLTLGHAIFVLQDGASTWRDQDLIAHELVHVAQVEKLGLEGFLHEYLSQCLSVGYDFAPLELEARAFRVGAQA
jgi:hypothetical protein